MQANFQEYTIYSIREVLDDFVLVYLDDVFIYSNLEEDHVEHVKWNKKCHLQAGLYLKPEKCENHWETIRYFGLILSMMGILLDPHPVLTTGPNSQVRSGVGSTRTRTVATGLTTRTTRPIGNGPVLPPKTPHFNITSLLPIKYLSSDRIMIWSVRRLRSSYCSSTSRSKIFDPTNIRWVAIENPLISLEICPFFTATQRISVESQIAMREVNERPERHNLRTDHVMIRWELKDLIGAKVLAKW